MKCPSCGKELERMKRQVGTTESGDPIFNEYAVCRDCKKQWNLDRQRARKIAAKKEAEQAEAKPVDKAESKVAVRPAESSVSKKGAAEENPAAKKPPVKRPAAGSDAEKVKEAEKKAEAKPAKRRRPTDAEGKPVRPKASRPISNDETAEISEKPEKRPVKKKVRPASTEEPLSTKTPGEKKASAKKPVKKRHPEEASDTNKASDEQKYGNIPAEQVRTKREKAVRKGYEEMLATDPDSKFAKKKKKDAAKLLPSEDEVVQMDELTWKLLGEAGYEHYEISNYALPESVCRHNLKYWHCEEYLGVGTGAASYMKTNSSGDYCRLKVITDTKAFSEIDWNDPLSLDKCFAECDILSLQEQMEEMAFLGLRTKEGVRLPSFYERFGKSFNEVYGEVVKKYTAMGMMKADETHVALTLKGMEVANWIMADFCG